MSRVAFITGGNDITGSAILEYLVNYPQSSEWDRFIVTSRSPFQTTVHDDRITFLALDFSQEAHILCELMREVCKDITNAYFSTYVHKDDFVELNTANQALFENFLDALVEVAPRLQNVTLQTGGKHYNVHLGPVPSPAREAEPRRETAVGNFYYQQEDHLIRRSEENNWSWNVIRPEAIIGYTSKPNGQEAPMPTNQIYWTGFDDVSDSRLIADLTIWASVPSAGNQAFNITNGDSFCWRYMWPRLAGYLGAKASADYRFTKAAPEEGTPQLEFSLAEWAADKRPVWDSLCERAGAPQAKATWDSGTWHYQDWVFQRSWCATLSINKARKFGWTGHMDSFESITQAFEKFAQLGQIPKFT